MGTLSPYPWDLSLSGNNGSLQMHTAVASCLPLVGSKRHPVFCEEGRIVPVPPLPQLSRRSGRVPAEPYPPLSCNQYHRTM
jgi:hypothetical protein